MGAGQIFAVMHFINEAEKEDKKQRKRKRRQRRNASSVNSRRFGDTAACILTARNSSTANGYPATRYLE